ncbi:hypothetical protein [Ensifer sp. Root127]|uniref:hypothetical protein n=1 Tax=Ensifer sp. Root127 TaxID=1736440 RepID=UPI00070D484A|nr:hypothetical protein [Ensifer sp. Root127]KQW82036.1 hypothetical protein ASD03_23240 [Ensifer sp. Root127]
MALKECSVILAATLIFAPQVHGADVKMRVCFGDDVVNGCPVSTDVMFSCGNENNATFQKICSRVENGKRVLLDFSVTRQGTHSGGKCGYAWFELTCHEK